MTRHDSEPDLTPLNAGEEQRLCALLLHAFAPREIDLARHEQLILAALEDPFAEPSPEELVQSERLRRALEGDGEHADLDLARALANAHAPSKVAPSVGTPAALAARSASDAGPASAPHPKASAKVFSLRFGAIAAGLAAAAALLFSLQSRPNRAPVADLPTLALAQSRSTAALFEAASAGPPSARIDRIVSVRERDLRDNRYALWGVR